MGNQDFCGTSFAVNAPALEINVMNEIFIQIFFSLVFFRSLFIGSV